MEQIYSTKPFYFLSLNFQLSTLSSQLSTLNSQLSTLSSQLPKVPNLPAVEDILENGIESEIDGGQWVQIIVGHPDAHGCVFLSEQLPARDGVAIFAA